MASRRNPYAVENPYGKASTGTQGVNDAIYKQGGGKNFFTDEASQVVEGFGGGAGIVEGVFTGDGRKIKEGIGHVANSVGSALSAAPIRNALKGPDPSYYGGSKGAGAAMQARNDAGIMAGMDTAGAGVGVAGTAANMAGGTYNQAGTLGQMGVALGGQGIYGQNQALDASIGAAGTQVGSLAEQMARQQTEQQARQMVGQAAAARGGNQAAAIRGAQQVAAQQAAQTNGQLALLRLQEEQDRRAAMVQAQQFAAGQYGGQAQLGFGTAGDALGVQNAATGQVNQAGSTIGQIGTTTTGQFLDAETEQAKAQLAADQANQEAKSKHKAGLLKGLSSGIASIWGGG